MEKSSAAGPAASLADRIDREQRETLAAQALRKRATGQTLTHRELSAITKVERERTEHFGAAYLAAMPKGDYAILSGRQPKQLIELATKYGFPYPTGRNAKTVDVRAILRWFHDFHARNAGQLAAGSGDSSDESILQLCSKELKDEFIRQKIEQSRIDNARKKIELESLSENYLPVEPLRQFHNRLAELLRRIRTKFAKHFDADDREFAEQAFESLITDWQRLAHAHFHDDDADHADDRQWASDLDAPELETSGPS